MPVASSIDLGDSSAPPGAPKRQADRIRVRRWPDLSEKELDVWSSIVRDDNRYWSPYFHPRFAGHVAKVRPDVEVILLASADEPVGFLPIQRRHFGLADPVGGLLSDFHGVIHGPKIELSARKLLADCELNAFRFHHLLDTGSLLRDADVATDRSHFIDLSNGFAAYEESIRDQGSHLLKEYRSKIRKIERDLGPIRFESRSTDPTMLDLLLEWKRRQYRKSNLVDVFGPDWTRALLHRILGDDGNDFGGMLSVLWAGDRPLAIHMGMRSAKVWNWWFPRHDESLSKYSPGIVLRLQAAEHAEKIGIERIDLGFGGQDTYKPRLSSGGIDLAVGEIRRPSIVNLVRDLRRSSEAWVRKSPLLPLARVPGRLLTRWERTRRFR
jgi:CelD/BcsL family acetyltransferase involved in cellulose biosynthesis